VDQKTVEHDARGVSATTTVDVGFGSGSGITVGPLDVRYSLKADIRIGDQDVGFVPEGEI